MPLRRVEVLPRFPEALALEPVLVLLPEGIHLEFLPPASPELRPAERLWPLVNEAVANRLFEEIENLEESLVKRCVALCGQPETIRSYTRYHWWPEVA